MTPKISVVKGRGRRKRQIDLLPTFEFGWDRRGVDLSVSFLVWYAYAEIWIQT